MSLSGVTVRYGATTALSDVALEVIGGEIRGLIGLNGSGKSTLVKVLAGTVTPETGRLLVSGNELALPIDPKQREELGWGFVFQDLSLLQSARVADSFLAEGFHASTSWWVNDRAEVAWVQNALDVLRVPVDARALTSSLSPAEQAMVAIARAAIRVEGVGAASDHGRSAEASGTVRAGLLVLDEPTALLPGDEAELIYDLVKRVRSRGHGVILVSHHLDEILALADTVTVLTDGKVEGVVVPRQAGHAKLVELMLGGGANAKRYTTALQRASDAALERSESGAAPVASKGTTAAPPVLAVEGMWGKRVRDIRFTLTPGEILGLTGVVGAGHEEIPYLLFGAKPWKSGSFILSGRRYNGAAWDVVDAVRAGVGLVPGDRAESGIMEMTIQENITLPSISEFAHLTLIDKHEEAVETERLIAEMGVKAKGPGARLGSLSGGNQQKISVAKWLRRDPVLLLLHEPTQGVDVGARAEIHQIIKAASLQGMSVVWTSNDFDELAAVCNRVIVIGGGAMVTEMLEPLTPERIALECLAAG